MIEVISCKMWQKGNYGAPNSPIKPLALQSLDHSQLYLRRKESLTQHLADEQNRISEYVSNVSPNVGDYEDLSEQEWTNDQNSISSAVWSSSPRPKSFKVSFSNDAPVLPPRSSSMVRHSLSQSSLESTERVR